MQDHATVPVFKEFSKGLWKENPVLVLVLGMCPTLATTSNAASALGIFIPLIVANCVVRGSWCLAASWRS